MSIRSGLGGMLYGLSLVGYGRSSHATIARLDVLARNEDLQQKLVSSNEWDLIICDEAHRMSATYFSGDVKYTKRYQLGQQLGQVCRHLLLMAPRVDALWMGF
jgi:hypothetical protein